MTQPHSTANLPTNTYEIVAHSHGAGYDVQVLGFDGARNTMLSFESEGAAEAWIAEDKARDKAQGKPG